MNADTQENAPGPTGSRRRLPACVLLATALALCAAPAPAATPEGSGFPSTDELFDLQSLLSMAQQGDKRAAFLLGTRYASGRGGVRDDSEAVRWFRTAAEAGLAEAQYNLGIMYANGRGVTPDLAEAARWYSRAAEQGLAEAQFNLGTLYGTGRGVGRDEGRAAAWMERAAERGLARAQYNLGVFYEHGRGVRLDAQKALAWYRRAADQGYQPAEARHAVLERRLQAPLEAGAVAGEDAAAPVVPAAPSEAAAEAAPAPAPPATASARRPAAVAGPGGWVAGLDPRHYTVQLASFKSKKDAEAMQARLPEGEPSGIYRSTKRGTQWFSVVRGDYSSSAAARAAVARLPESLRRIKPWIRKAGQIQGEMD